ncbi:YciI family protein [Variovorax sp. KK3]|uniref:YciI family protein n=1 Tax=Variovorax sp. KK3 TaxID=1855728 RepID=UPI00097BF63B|nr:YciI family protein [Variovorax sp. KK3]
MRFVILHGAGPHGAAGQLPTPDPRFGAAIHESIALQPAETGVRMARIGDDDQDGLQVVDGPVTAPLAGLSIVEAESREAAAQWLGLAASHGGDTTYEIRETGCAGGLGGIDPRDGASRPRFLVLVKADAATESESPSNSARLAAMARRNDEAVQSGLLRAGDGLRSTARATRVRVGNGRPSVLDGPFAETKELVAGFWLIQADSMAEAIDWVGRYPFAQDRPEVEIRPVAG